MSAGIFHTETAITSPTPSPAAEACQAGRRNTPKSRRTATTGKSATQKDSPMLSATGKSNCLNMSAPENYYGTKLANFSGEI